MPQNSSKKRFTPVGIIFALAGLLLFVYFVYSAGPRDILARIKALGVGFVLIIAISAIRQVVRSVAWMMCFEGPGRLRFWDAFRARVMGDAIGNIVPFTNFVISEPAKPALIRDRVPLMAGLSSIAIENIFYSLSVSVFIFSGMTALLLSFNLAKPLRIAGIGILAGIAMLIVVASLLVRCQYRFISGVLGFLGKRGIGKNWVEQGRSLEDRVYGFYQRNGARFLPILLLEACFHLTGAAEVYVTLLFISPGQPPTFFTAFILESVNRVINVVFKMIPLRMGVDEAGTGAISTVLQFTKLTGVTLAIVRKSRDIFWAAVGVALLIHRGLSLRAIADEAEAAIAAQEIASQASLGAAAPNESS
jgi:hypothetical protein